MRQYNGEYGFMLFMSRWNSKRYGNVRIYVGESHEKSKSQLEWDVIKIIEQTIVWDVKAYHY